MLLALAHMTLDHLQSFDDDAVFLRHHRDDFAALAFFFSGQHDHFIAFFNMKSFLHNFQITSGASEIIFMNFFSRNSRATGPKMRVPFGFNSLSMMTHALLSKRKYEPSARRIISRVRTITASCTSPFFTEPSGAATLM